MKINSINACVSAYTPRKVKKVNVVESQTRNAGRFKVVSMSEYFSSPLSFKGRNKEQVIFYGAEAAPYSKSGGVGVVMKDYGFMLDPKNEVVVTPYYKANVNKKTGEVTPQKDKDGNFVLEIGKDNYKILDLVAEKEMQWGNKEKNKIMLFSLKDEKEKVHYFVFDEATAFYQKPYEGGAVYASGSKSETNAWNGDPYARHSKAFVELLPELIKSKENFDPATIVCSDSQTSYAHEYMVQKAVKDKDYDEIKTTHVGHNLGPGYCGETSMQNMFVNLGATPEQIKMIEKDPIFKQNILGDEYFRPFVEKTLDETGTASATQIALHHANNGFVRSFSVVAEDYADAIATNPQAAHNIHESAKDLYKRGIFNGILNPLEDDSVNATKVLPNPRYNEDCVDTDGKTYKAFELYPENPSYEEMRAIKNRNKQKLLERFSALEPTIYTGTPGRGAKLNPDAEGIYSGPVIRPELIKMIEEGKGDEVPVLVSWGRSDTQKGHDISLSAFEKFAKTEEGKNAIFILGAGLDKSAESLKVKAKLKEMFKDPDLQGRIVHIDGWAPAYALSSAADAAVFTSRFEPCGLTDLEAMKYYCTPIVANTQGFKQKNFDPRIPKETNKATSFKTKHEFHLAKPQVDLIIDAYVHNKEEAQVVIKEEFPSFWTEKDGKPVYDDSAFVKFAQEYSAFIEAREKELEAENPSKPLPENWKDWDELSKDYEFKFTGFARDMKDAVLIEETAEAISAFAKIGADKKALIFNNQKKLDTGWKGNQNLHPSGKSSFELYKEHHMMPDYKKPSESDIIAVQDNKIIEDKIEERQSSDLQDRVGIYVLGALTGLSAVLFKRMGKPNPTAIENELIGRITGLEQKIAEQEQTIQEQAGKLLKTASKKNLVIAGALSAVGAAAVTFVATKKFINKKANNTESVVAAPEDNKEEKTQTSATHVVNNAPVVNNVEKQLEQSANVATAPVEKVEVKPQSSVSQSATNPQVNNSTNVFEKFSKLV